MSLKIVVVVLILALSVSVCWIMLYGSNPYDVIQLPAVSMEAHGEIEDSLKYNQGTETQVMLPALQGEMVLAVPSRFLYLVQTESCLPGLLKSVEAFGDLLACQCDVLVLSYKEVCNDSTLRNVEYLFNSSTTWASGRNLLFEASMSSSEKYLYYIFMDDDIVLSTSTKDQNPWREFEIFLKKIEPAVAAVETFPQHQVLPMVYKAREDRRCRLSKTAECLPIVGFDEAFNGFHYQAVEHLLPYPEKFDAKTWWYYGLSVRIKGEIMFRGQVVLHTALRAHNALHRPYPRGFTIGLDFIINKVMAELPTKYQESSLALEWKRDGIIKHQQNSATLCLPPPLPHMPIKPYAHFNTTAGVL